ncbi:MAG TPA: N-acyl homoserine lactonase family protein [Candidatus Acidoferrales bacterium]|jgi:glyoxylase-like metal-dependent hydrolase (beta-lactamase superfamily II)|nr:N-acyl homoserine lactonase family protein [Candidatus Acidoferrales bacterium]
MKKQFGFVVLAVVGILHSSAAWAQSSGKTADRLYVLDCGTGHAPDESRWTVGFNVGKPIDISVSCYLVRHGNEYFLWDTGISDAVAAMPDGWYPSNNPATDIHWSRAKTLESQLAGIGVKPSDIKFVGISHTHPDHIGNAELFPAVPFLIQKTEYDYYFAPGKTGIAKPPSDSRPTFLKEHPATMVQEDLDVFGDRSVMLIFTPGHTPGHQSCMVHLAKTGWILLTGDAVHLQDNWDNRRVPYFTTMPAEQKVQTQLSMQRMADLLSFYHAQLWINHEKAQSDKLKHAPAYYE